MSRDPQIPGYTLEARLGQGAFGTVWQALWNGGFACAVKVLEGAALHRGYLESVLERVMQLPPQAGMLPVYAFDLEETVPHVSMALVPGGAVTFDHLAGKLSAAEAWSLLRQLAVTLSWLHRHGIVHAGLTGGNVLVAAGTDGRARALVTDAGQAWLGEGEMERLHDQAPYLPPERWRDPAMVLRPGTGAERWDVYAYGVLAWRLLHGRWPRAHRLFDRVLASRAEPLSVDPPAFAEWLMEEPAPVWPLRVLDPLTAGAAGVILKCLALDPAERPGSMMEVSRLLENAGRAAVTMPVDQAREPAGRAPAAVPSAAGETSRPVAAPSFSDVGNGPAAVGVAVAATVRGTVHPDVPTDGGSQAAPLVSQPGSPDRAPGNRFANGLPAAFWEEGAAGNPSGRGRPAGVPCPPENAGEPGRSRMTSPSRLAARMRESRPEDVAAEPAGAEMRTRAGQLPERPSAADAVLPLSGRGAGERPDHEIKTRQEAGGNGQEETDFVKPDFSAIFRPPGLGGPAPEPGPRPSSPARRGEEARPGMASPQGAGAATEAGFAESRGGVRPAVSAAAASGSAGAALPLRPLPAGAPPLQAPGHGRAGEQKEERVLWRDAGAKTERLVADTGNPRGSARETGPSAAPVAAGVPPWAAAEGKNSRPSGHGNGHAPETLKTGEAGEPAVLREAVAFEKTGLTVPVSVPAEGSGYETTAAGGARPERAGVPRSVAGKPAAEEEEEEEDKDLYHPSRGSAGRRLAAAAAVFLIMGGAALALKQREEIASRDSDLQHVRQELEQERARAAQAAEQRKSLEHDQEERGVASLAASRDEWSKVAADLLASKPSDPAFLDAWKPAAAPAAARLKAALEAADAEPALLAGNLEARWHLAELYYVLGEGNEALPLLERLAGDLEAAARLEPVAPAAAVAETGAAAGSAEEAGGGGDRGERPAAADGPSSPHDTSGKLLLARVHARRGAILLAARRTAEAAPLLTAASQAFETWTAAHPDRHDAAREYAENSLLEGRVQAARQQPEAARAALGRVSGLLGQPGDGGFAPGDYLILTDALLELSALESAAGKLDVALNQHMQAVRLLVACDLENPKSVPCRRRLADGYFGLGRLLTKNGTPRDASVAFSEAVKLLAELSKEAPEEQDYRLKLALTYNEVAQLVAAAKPNAAGAREALVYQDGSVTILENLNQSTTLDDTIRRHLATALVLNGELLEAAGDPKKAQNRQSEALALTGELLEETSLAETDRRECRRLTARAWTALGGMQEKAGRKDEAIESLSKALEAWTGFAGEDPSVEQKVASTRERLKKLKPGS